MFTKLADKDPEADKIYTFDWSDWLQPGESIASFTITVTPGITFDNDTNNTPLIPVRILGGVDGQSENIECEIVTNSTPPQTEHRTFSIDIKHT